MVVGLGVVNLGYSIGVFNSMHPTLFGVLGISKKDADDIWIKYVQGICSLGTALGSLFTGPLARFGKKNCMHIANLIVIIGGSLTLVANIYVILAGRFLFGFGAGMFAAYVPSFINEITPVELRSSFGSST